MKDRFKFRAWVKNTNTMKPSEKIKLSVENIKMKIKTDIFCGSQMYAARLINDMTLEDLEDETGINRQRLKMYENGITQPTQKEEKLIAQALSVKPVFFYWLDTAPLKESECTFSLRMKNMR